MSKKSLITNDMINLVKSSVTSVEIEKMGFEECCAFSVGKVTISRGNDKSITIYADEGFDSEYRDIWKNDVGEILRKELHKDEPDLYVLKDSKFKALAKKISDEELDSFKENGFDHIKIGDSYFTIIRIVKPSHVFSYKEGYNDYSIEQKIESYTTENEENDIIEDNLKSTELF